MLGCCHRDIPQSTVITAADRGHLEIAHDLLHSGISLTPEGCEFIEIGLRWSDDELVLMSISSS
jgi:hypothetical protein